MTDLQAVIGEMLEEYGNDVKDVMEEVLDETAKKASKNLKSVSPRRTGRYAKGWTSELEKSRLSVTATVYGKSGTYQIAHLLENGHAKRGGGRVGAIPHIKQVEEWAIEEVENKLKQKVEQI